MAEEVIEKCDNSQDINMDITAPKEDANYKRIIELVTLYQESSAPIVNSDTILNLDVELLQKYPCNVVVLERVCLSLCLVMDSVASIESAIKAYSHSEEFVSNYLTALQNIVWRGRSVSFIESVVHSTAFVVNHFPEQMTNNCKHILISLYLTVLNFESHDNREMIAAGQSFPTLFPGDFYILLDAKGVHGKLRDILLHYNVMKDTSVNRLLQALLGFIKANSSTASAYVTDSTHFTLLFVAQHFAKSSVVQQTLWEILVLLTTHAPQFGAELCPEVIAPAITTLITEQIECSVSIHPVVAFMINYTLNVHGGIPLVMACFTMVKEFLPTILKILDDTRNITQTSQKEELGIVSDLMVTFCTKIEGYNTIQYILDHQIIDHLERAALKWPEISCTSFFEALNKFLQQFSPDPSALLTSLVFFSDNHLEVFAKLLVEPSTYNNLGIREGIYITMRKLLETAPEETIEAWLTREFLKVFVSSLDADLSRYPSRVQVFSLTAHYISYAIRTVEKMKVLHELKLHEIVMNKGLKLATTQELQVVMLNFIYCLLQGYQDAFSDTSVFAQGDFPQYLVDMVQQHGRGQKPEARELYGKIIVDLTFDKKSSSILYDKGILKALYSFVSDEYDPDIVRSSIEAVGNIALAGHNIISDILSQDFHKTLMTYLEDHMTSGETNNLISCMRVLQILASADRLEQYFAEKHLFDILIQVLATHKDNSEICWRSLDLLSSISFLSVINRELFVTSSILMAVKNVLTNSTDANIIRYSTLIFLAAIELDSRTADMRSLGIIDSIEQLLENKEFVERDGYFKQWGIYILELGQLFTIGIDAQRLHEPNEQVLASYLESSISWPTLPNASSLVDMTKRLSLIPPSGASLDSKTPLAQPLSTEAKASLLQLGLKPDEPIFRIGRMHGSNSHDICSNCNKHEPLEEISFRPHSLTPWQYQELINRGWYRRGDVRMCRWRINHSIDCTNWETRVLLSEFNNRKRKSHRKVLRRMPEDHLTIETVPAQFMRESYDLYNAYNNAKHDKPKESEISYCEHVVDCPVKHQVIDGFEYGTFHQLYRLDGRLVAVGVIDIVPSGIVTIYMWYDTRKEISKLSFGVYSSLKEIEYAQKLSQQNPSIKYYYIQGWNGNNHKLSYKANYEPEEFYNPCNVVDWVQGLDGVAEVHAAANKQTISDLPKTEQNEGKAQPFDRVHYKKETGMDAPDVFKTVVCLNNYKYMYLHDMLDGYSVGPKQCKIIKDKVEELMLALGPQLLSNMVIDFLACPKYNS